MTTTLLASLRLFKAVPITRKSNSFQIPLQETLSKGFLVSPEVNYNNPGELLKIVEQLYGRSGERLNQSFHKSWSKVQHASTRQLVLEQMLHYITTYGFERLGIYSQESVYIPGEQFTIPALREEGLSITIIHGYTKEDLKEKLLQLLASGIALHEQTVSDVVTLAKFVALSVRELEQVKNREVRAALYESFGIVPGNPTEFLRYVITQVTGKTLLIKNDATIAAIKASDAKKSEALFARYEQAYGLARLSEIFHRFKPIFLAFRTTHQLRQTVNKIRKLAEHNHVPMQPDTLNTVTAKLAQQKPWNTEEFYQALSTASVFRKIRLAYALKFRTTGADSILYRVRNGKSFATEFAFSNQEEAQAAYDIVLLSLVEDVAQNVAGKRIYIPSGIQYALPATEKQFTGNIPSGTAVRTKRDTVVGVHWQNVEHHRIDLDLSLLPAGGDKLGWDGRYRTEQRNILFSGDMTDASEPNGASELFYLDSTAKGVYLLLVNYYNHQEDVEVPFQILVSQERPINATSHYTVEPNCIVALSNTSINVKQKNLGILVAERGECTFYFAETSLGASRSSRDTEYTTQARKYLLDFYRNTIMFNDILLAAGAELVHSVKEADIDLSIETLQKDTILQLLYKSVGK